MLRIIISLRELIPTSKKAIQKVAYCLLSSLENLELTELEMIKFKPTAIA